MFKQLIQASAVAVALGSMLFAQAAHPRSIRGRQITQQRRIGQGVASGQLTPRETTKLERHEGALNREIRRDRIDGGGLTLKERRKINRQQNRLSREIYREKHDNQTVPPAR